MINPAYSERLADVITKKVIKCITKDTYGSPAFLVKLKWTKVEFIENTSL